MKRGLHSQTKTKIAILAPLIMNSIKDTIFRFLRLDNLVNNATGYLDARVELLKIEIREEVAHVLAKGIIVVIVALLSLLFLLFLSVGLAHFLNSYLRGAHIGYWIVAGMYGIPCLIFVLFRKQISHSMETHLTKLMKRKKQ
jgi:uncharacterized membrane protein YqjE